jgi:hypothetical protein
MFEFDLTPELVVAVFATVTAFVFDYFPGVAKWFDALEEATKKRYVFGALFLVVAVMFAGDCFAVFVTYLTCNLIGGFEAVKLLLAAVAINQGVHALFKPTENFKAKMFG